MPRTPRDKCASTILEFEERFLPEGFPDEDPLRGVSAARAASIRRRLIRRLAELEYDDQLHCTASRICRRAGLGHDAELLHTLAGDEQKPESIRFLAFDLLAQAGHPLVFSDANGLRSSDVERFHELRVRFALRLLHARPQGSEAMLRACISPGDDETAAAAFLVLDEMRREEHVPAAAAYLGAASADLPVAVLELVGDAVGREGKKAAAGFFRSPSVLVDPDLRRLGTCLRPRSAGALVLDSAGNIRSWIQIDAGRAVSLVFSVVRADQRRDLVCVRLSDELTLDGADSALSLGQKSHASRFFRLEEMGGDGLREVPPWAAAELLQRARLKTLDGGCGLDLSVIAPLARFEHLTQSSRDSARVVAGPIPEDVGTTLRSCLLLTDWALRHPDQRTVRDRLVLLIFWYRFGGEHDKALRAARLAERRRTRQD